MPKTRSQKVTLEVAGQCVPVFLEFCPRQRLSISVHPDCSVTAKVPLERPLSDVMHHLRKRASWIAKQRRYFEEYQPFPLEKRYVSGETHLYLGRQYRLRLNRADDTQVKLTGRFFQVNTVTPEEPTVVQSLLQQWYRCHAERLFQEIVLECLSKYAFLRQFQPLIKIRNMTYRWGSCSAKGTLTLNLELIKLPRHCIEYVIMHELCHLRYHDHSPAFFRLLTRCMPDWQQRKERLDMIVLR